MLGRVAAGPYKGPDLGIHAKQQRPRRRVRGGGCCSGGQTSGWRANACLAQSGLTGAQYTGLILGGAGSRVSKQPKHF